MHHAPHRPALIRCLALALGLALPLAVARAAEEDPNYSAGVKAYRAGDVVGAMKPLRLAADAGHAGAQAALADILDRSEFDEEAVAWYRKSAAQGNAEGQYGLGAMLAAGEGAKQDPAEARKWIEQAAAQGHALAINTLAQGYLTSSLGLEAQARETPEGHAAILRAAQNDYLPAIDALAAAYQSGGLGLAADPAQASQWAAKARQLRGLKEQRPVKKRR